MSRRFWGSYKNASGLPGTPRLWLEADKKVYSDTAGTIPAVDNDPVDQWQDQTPNSFTFLSLASASPWPKFQTNAINGKPAVEFDSVAGTYLTCTGVTNLLANSDQYTIFAVVGPKNDGTSANTGCIISQDEGSGGTDKFILANGGVAGGGKFEIHVNDPAGSASYTLQTTAARVTTAWKCFTFRRKTDGTWASYVNGVADNSGVGLTALTRNNTGDIALGNAESAFPLIGQVALVVAYSTALSDSDLTKAHNYITTKYAL